MTTAHAAHLFFLLFFAETWKRVPGWDAYEVSNWGRLKSFWVRAAGGPRNAMTLGPQGRLIRPGHERTGHIHYTLCDQGRQWTVKPANLVLMAFDRTPETGEEARHVHDPDPINNWRWNLSWGTRKDNMVDKVRHGNSSAKLGFEDVAEIRRQLAAGTRGKDLAERYGVSKSAITLIKQRKNWAHAPES